MMFRFGVLVLFALGTQLTAAQQEPCTSTLALTKAIELAQNEARTRGYDPARMGVDADEANTAWSTYLVGFGQYNPVMARTEPRLRGRRFVAVYLHPPASNPPPTGGDVWVLIDRCSGGVIDVIEGY
jgi:hypothetical protein